VIFKTIKKCIFIEEIKSPTLSKTICKSDSWGKSSWWF